MEERQGGWLVAVGGSVEDDRLPGTPQGPGAGDLQAVAWQDVGPHGRALDRAALGSGLCFNDTPLWPPGKGECHEALVMT